MKKLLMIISVSLFMVACAGGECEKEGSCCKGDKKECSKDATHEGHGDMEHGEHHEGHGDMKHACEPGCTKACCADKNTEANDSTDELGLTDEDIAVGAAIHTILRK
jgi:hypothetical protein